MVELKDSDRKFMNSFSDLYTFDVGSLRKKVLPNFDRFMTNEIGTQYIGNMLKDIDIRLYLVYLKMLENSIKFSDNFYVDTAVCISSILSGVTKNVQLHVPTIKNGMDIMVTSHEIGHGIKSFTKVDNSRYLHFDTLFNETISILFGRVCLERYINDFGFDICAQQFEVLNISNAISCLKKIKEILPDYMSKLEAKNKRIEFINKTKNNYDKNCEQLILEVENFEKELCKLISYPIGIALANVYDNFDKKQKDEYLKLVSKFLLNIKQIDFEMILDYFDIPFDVNFYKANFSEYINKFSNTNNKVLVPRGVGKC